MSRPQESIIKCAKTGKCILNITVESEHEMSKIMDSLKGFDNTTIDAKEIKSGVYDFIINFGLADYKNFHEKFIELCDVLGKDFPGYDISRLHKYRPADCKEKLGI